MKALSRYVADTLQNFVSAFGTSKDKNYHNQYVLVPLTADQLEAAYRGDWIARKVIDCPAQDSTRQWRSWRATEDQVELLDTEEKRLGIQRKTKQAIIRGRLFGGGIILMAFKNHKHDEPLNVERVSKGDLEYIHVLTRSGVASGPLVKDPLSPYFNQPEYYDIRTSNGFMQTARIHPSRVVRFCGNELPDPDSAGADGWGDSVLQSIDDAVKNVGLCETGIAALVNESKIDVIRIPNLMSQIGTAEYKNLLTERFTLANQAKSILNTLLLDKEEEWDRINANFAGLPEVLKLYLLIAAGAADIPATRLLGQSPAGLNSTGDGDIRNYYDRISSDQNNEMTPTLEPLDEAIIRSALGARPPEVYFEWNSLWQMSDDEKSQISLRKAQAHKVDVDAGLIDPNVLREAREAQLMADVFYPGYEQIKDEFEDENRDLLEEKREATERQFEQVKAAAALARGNGKALDARPRSLYVYRSVINTTEISDWAVSQGFVKLSLVNDLHVTILYSKSPVDWIKMGNAYTSEEQLEIKAGGPRVVESLGNEGAVVLQFACSEIQWRHHEMCERGASHDYDEYIPHVTLTYQAGGLNVDSIVPYRGRIVLGPEIFQEID